MDANISLFKFSPSQWSSHAFQHCKSLCFKRRILFWVKMNEDDISSIMTTIRRTWKLKFILPARFPYYTEYFNFAYSMKDTLEELVLDLQYNDYSTQLMEFTKSKKIKVTNAPSVQILLKHSIM